MTANLRRDPADVTSQPDREASGGHGSSESTVASDRAPTDPVDTTVSPDSPDVRPDELLALLGDEYACDILRALDDGPLAARELIERCEMSRPTVYRRLDRLTDAGLVEARTRPDRDGHHRKEFHLVLDEVEVQVQPDGLAGTVRVDDAACD